MSQDKLPLNLNAPSSNRSSATSDWQSQPADRRLIEELFVAGYLTAAARQTALDLLYPRANWQLWISRLLLTSSVSLLLSSVIYFFAFNWARLSPALKLGMIEVGLIGALGASWYYSLKHWVGQLSLLVAAVLVGVFLAVFGQIYQSGADAYELFVYWAILILPWVLLARFAPLWGVWVVVANLGGLLYWVQERPVGEKEILLICPLLAVFNGLLLVLREFTTWQGVTWLSSSWTRNALSFLMLLYLSVPVLALIFDGRRASAAGWIGTSVAILVHLLFYVVYRIKIRDLINLVFTLFSACMLVELTIGKLLLSGSVNTANPLIYLVLGIITLALFTATTLHLRQLSKNGN
jgi:uncharacterized membrane protein